MMKVMSILVNFLICYLFIANANANANANVFETQSFSSEGAELICEDKKNSDLLLNVYGETFKSNIKVINSKPHNYRIKAKFSYYDRPIYEKFRNILTIDYDFYIENDQVLVSLLGSDYSQKINEIYESIKQILKEAHENNKCLSWNFK